MHEHAARLRAARPRAPGRHLLRSRIAAEIVVHASVPVGTLVLDIGAGTGRLTHHLARRGHRVVAIDVDAVMLDALSRRFAGAEHVAIVDADATVMQFPPEPFRVVANPPFARSGAILDHLFFDPAVVVERADLILAWDAARKRAQVWPSSLRAAYWGAWYRIGLERRLSRTCFDPPPAVDAGLLVVTRRPHPLVRVTDAARYRRWVRDAFAAPSLCAALAGVLSRREQRRLAVDAGFRRDAAPRELDVYQWARVFAAITALRPG